MLAVSGVANEMYFNRRWSEWQGPAFWGAHSKVVAGNTKALWFCKFLAFVLRLWREHDC